MAQQTITNIVDDIDGESPADFPGIEFSLDGVSYEIDLSTANRERLVETLAEYVQVARRTGGRRKPPRSTSGQRSTASIDKEQGKIMRNWARLNGFPELGDRGRIAQHIVDAYNEAMTPPEPKSKAATRRKRDTAKASA